MLTEQQNQLWQGYLDQEQSGSRQAAEDALSAFINAMQSAPAESRSEWTRDLCRRVVDDKEPIPVRYALFERVIAPALLEGYRAKSPGSARWLAGFPTFLCHCEQLHAELGDGEVNQTGLLRKAIEHDPDDKRARRRLVELMADWFSFTLHELPAGVLADMSMGANPAQCAELRDQLERFCDLCQAIGATETHARLIADCKYHYSAYADYLQHLSDYKSYAEYLERSKVAAT